MPKSPDHESESIRALIARIDAAWRQKRLDGLDNCFHADALIVGPGSKVMARGRSACVESYREFAHDAGVLEYSEADHVVNVWGTTAVYTCSFEGCGRLTYPSTRTRLRWRFAPLTAPVSFVP